MRFWIDDNRTFLKLLVYNDEHGKQKNNYALCSYFYNLNKKIY